MNRVEFMGQLERLLCNLPDEERQDALDYYNDYFDEAGSEHEPEVLRELGSPGRVAAMIRAGYQNGSEASQHGEYTENGYRETQFGEHAQPPVRYGDAGEESEHRRSTASDFVDAAAQKARSWKEEQNRRREEQSSFNSTGSQDESSDSGSAGGSHYQPPERQRRGAGGWALIVILLIFVGVPVLKIISGTFRFTWGILDGVFSVFGSGIVMLVKGIGGIIRGSVMLITSPGTALLTIGLGCFTIAFGVLITMFIVWLLFKILPRVVRAVVNLVARITHHGDTNQSSSYYQQREEKQGETRDQSSEEGGA